MAFSAHDSDSSIRFPYFLGLETNVYLFSSMEPHVRGAPTGGLDLQVGGPRVIIIRKRWKFADRRVFFSLF